MKALWWAVARSEEVSSVKPLAVDIGDQAVVLWRDKAGIARALEDRCPHRRAPLSLGCVRKEGWLQCGYHGWSFAGDTGRVMEVPNLKDEQRFPALYRAERFAVHESAGFVRVSLDASAEPPTDNETEAMPLHGTAHVSLDHERYLAALFDDPGLMLAIRGVSFTTYLMSELHKQGNRLLMERNCQWKGLHWPASNVSDYPLALLSSTDPQTGETDLELRDADFRTVLNVTLAPVPAARGVTAVRWRAMLGEARSGWHSRLLGFGQPFEVLEAIDGAALRKLLPSVSVRFDQLRSGEIPMTAEAVAQEAIPC